MLYALIGRPTPMFTDADPLKLDKVLQAEQAKTAEYQARGALRQLWLFADQGGAVLLCETETDEGAQAISVSYPMVQAGYITHEIHALQPGLFA